jgi:MFS family permease
MMGDFLRAFRLFSRNARLFLVCYGFAFFANFGIYSVLFNLFLVRLGYGSQFIGVTNAINLVNLAIFSLPAGWLGRRWGSRRLLLYGLGFAFAGMALLPLSELMPSLGRSAWILATYGLFGFGNALFIVNAPPFMMGSSTSKERNYVFSAQAAVGALAAFAGNLIGGFLPGLFSYFLRISLDHPAPYRFTLLIPPAFYLVAFLLFLKTEAPASTELGERRSSAAAFPWLIVAVMGLVMMLRFFGEFSARVFFNVYMDVRLGASTSLIGILAATAQLVSVPSALIMPRLARVAGRFPLVVYGLLGMGLALVLMAIVPHWLAAGLVLLSITALHAIVGPSSVIYQQELVSLQWRSVISGTTTMAIGIGSSVVAFGGGFAISAFGYRTFFFGGALSLAIGSLTFWLFFRTPRGQLAQRG